MKVTRNGSAAFAAEFESEQELREEHRTNLAHNALCLRTSETVSLHTTLLLTLRGPWGGEAFLKATAVAVLPDGIALHVDANPDELLQKLLAKSEVEKEQEQEQEKVEEEEAEKPGNIWERIRSLSQMEKLLLAVKADRSERAL